MPIYLPRLLTGASSATPAAPINSDRPAPAPAMDMPPMATSIRWAVPRTIMPMHTRPAPSKATYRRPIKSDMAPANGATAARAKVLEIASHAYESSPPISATVYAKQSAHYPKGELQMEPPRR